MTILSTSTSEEEANKDTITMKRAEAKNDPFAMSMCQVGKHRKENTNVRSNTSNRVCIEMVLVLRRIRKRNCTISKGLLYYVEIPMPGTILDIYKLEMAGWIE